MLDAFSDLTAFFSRPLQYPILMLPWVFIAGGIVGSLLNVCIFRLPLEKSILWPSSRCLRCLHPIAKFDNLPLIGYLRLGGKCRHCGQSYSSRYFWIELFTATAFAATFYWCLTLDQARPASLGEPNYFQPASKGTLLLLWLHQVLLLCFLIVVTFTDIDHREIPLTVTIPGTAIGILMGMLVPWPLPMVYQPPIGVYFGGYGLPPDSLSYLPIGAAQPWPAWLPLPAALPAGDWKLGLATAVVGALVGTGLIRALRWVFSWGFGKEAMGLGDADLLMMIGAFLGWQACFLSLLYGVAFALLYAIVKFILTRGKELPFGPFLAFGAALLVWGPNFSWVLSQRFFFDGLFLVWIGGLASALALVMCFLIRTVRLVRWAA